MNSTEQERTGHSMDSATKERKNNFEIAPTCLSCFGSHLVFYWLTVTKDTTLKELEKALTNEEIHKKAKVPFLCNGDETFISDWSGIHVDEYTSAKDLFKYVEVLKFIEEHNYSVEFLDLEIVAYALENTDIENLENYLEHMPVEFNYLSDAHEFIEQTFYELEQLEGRAQELVEMFARQDDIVNYMQGYMTTEEVGSKTYVIWNAY